MNQEFRRLFLVLVVVMIIALIFSTQAMAIIIDNYDPKLNGVQGTITKMEGNKLTIKNAEGKFIILKVRDNKGFKIGDKVKIQNGDLRKIMQPND